MNIHGGALERTMGNYSSLLRRVYLICHTAHNKIRKINLNLIIRYPIFQVLDSRKGWSWVPYLFTPSVLKYAYPVNWWLSRKTNFWKWRFDLVVQLLNEINQKVHWTLESVFIWRNLDFVRAPWRISPFSESMASNDINLVFIHFILVAVLQVGWPTSLPTNEKDAFLKRILREKVNKFPRRLGSFFIPMCLSYSIWHLSLYLCLCFSWSFSDLSGTCDHGFIKTSGIRCCWCYYFL